MNRLIALATLLVFFATIYVNYLAGTGGINDIGTGEVSGLYPTLFTPAGFTFAIWSVIYLLNTVFTITNVVLAFSKPRAFQKRLMLLFLGVCLVNTSWIFAWHYDAIPVSVVLMLGILTLLVLAFSQSYNLDDKAFTSTLARINFGVYLGWISVATVANVSVWLAGKGNTIWTQTDLLWTCIVIAIAALLAVWMLFRFGSFAYALVISWALYGIYSARHGELSNYAFDVAGAALIALAVVLVTSGYVFTKKMLRLRSATA